MCTLDWRRGAGSGRGAGEQLAGPVLSPLHRLRPGQVGGRGELQGHRGAQGPPNPRLRQVCAKPYWIALVAPVDMSSGQKPT